MNLNKEQRYLATFIFIQSLLATFSPLYNVLFLGVALIVLVVFNPGGLKSSHAYVLFLLTVVLWYCLWHLSTMHLPFETIVGGDHTRQVVALFLSGKYFIPFFSFDVQVIVLADKATKVLGINTLNLSSFNIFLLIKWVFVIVGSQFEGDDKQQKSKKIRVGKMPPSSRGWFSYRRPAGIH